MQPSSSVLSLAGGIGIAESSLIVKEGTQFILSLLLAESIVSHFHGSSSAIHMRIELPSAIDIHGASLTRPMRYSLQRSL